MRYLVDYIGVVLAFISLLTYDQSPGVADLTTESARYIVKSELEETFDEDFTLYKVFEDISIEYSEQEGDTGFSCSSSYIKAKCFQFRSIPNIKEVFRLSNIAFFILYCCLKVNC